MSLALNTRQFEHTMRRYARLSKRTCADIVNLKSLHVVQEAIDFLPPHRDIDSQRTSVRNYLSTQLATPIKVATSGKRKGQVMVRKHKLKKGKSYARKWVLDESDRKKIEKHVTKQKQSAQWKYSLTGRATLERKPIQWTPEKLSKTINRISTRRYPLQRVHLIIQRRRERQGLPGLYGYKMFMRAGSFKRFSAVSVGYLKSVWLPLMHGLRRVVKPPYPKIATRWGKIARWPGGAGHGVVKVASQYSDRPTCLLNLGGRLRGPQTGKSRAERLENQAMQHGINAAEQDMRVYIARKMQGLSAKGG